jgi:hypothetical protein
MITHCPQIGYEVEIYDKDGVLKSKVANGSILMRDYKVIATVTDENGNQISKQEFPFQSYTYNFGRLMNNLLFEVDNTSLITNTSGSAIASEITKMNVMCTAAASTYGILVGLNDTTSGSLGAMNTYSFVTDWALKHQIIQGTTDGTMEYGAVTADTFYWGNGQLGFTRTFKNSGTTTITVKEVGLAATDGSSNYFLIARDTNDKLNVALSVAVAASQTLTVQYLFDNHSILQGDEVAGSLEETMTENFLGMLHSLARGASSSGMNVSGASASIDYSTNATYCSAIAADGEGTYGVLIGRNDPDVVDTNDYATPSVCTEGTAANQVAYGATTALDIATVNTSVTNPRGISGTTAKSIYSVRVGCQRDIQHPGTVTTTIGINSIYMLIAGSGSSTRYLINSLVLPTTQNLAALETMRVKLYILFPYKIA